MSAEAIHPAVEEEQGFLQMSMGLGICAVRKFHGKDEV